MTKPTMTFSDDEHDLALTQPRATLKVDTKHIKLVTLDSQGKNHEQWSHAFFEWLEYLQQVWLILPGSSTVMTFESCFSKYFKDAVDSKTQALLLRKAHTTAYLEMLGNEIIDMSTDDSFFGQPTTASTVVKMESEDDTADVSSSYQDVDIPPSLSPTKKAKSVRSTTSVHDEAADDLHAKISQRVPPKSKAVYDKKVQHHFHTLLTQHLSAQGDDLSYLRTLLSKHLRFLDHKTGVAESPEKASFRQLAWNTLFKTLVNIDHATICAGINNGDVFGAFKRVSRTKSVQSVDILHTNLFDKLCFTQI